MHRATLGKQAPSIGGMLRSLGDANFTACGQRCLAEAVAEFNCGSLSDIQCLCENDDVNNEVFRCVTQDCPGDQDFEAFAEVNSSCPAEIVPSPSPTTHVHETPTVSSTTSTPPQIPHPPTTLSSTSSSTDHDSPTSNSNPPSSSPGFTVDTSGNTKSPEDTTMTALSMPRSQTMEQVTSTVPSSTSVDASSAFSITPTSQSSPSSMATSTGDASSSGTLTAAREAQTVTQSHGPSPTTVISLSAALGSFVSIALVTLLAVWLRRRRRRRHGAEQPAHQAAPAGETSTDNVWHSSEERKSTNENSSQPPTKPEFTPPALTPNRAPTFPSETPVLVRSANPRPPALAPDEVAINTSQVFDTHASATTQSVEAERAASQWLAVPGDEASSILRSDEPQKGAPTPIADSQSERRADHHPVSPGPPPLPDGDPSLFQSPDAPHFVAVAVLMDLRASTDVDQPPPYWPRPPHMRLGSLQDEGQAASEQ
ncbi:hypothetical protein OH77DRAFT_1057629 [Trametes cingulata]|nr:hypothetical protein OH77DRAFT_1057629 [Trametes cingulata]